MSFETPQYTPQFKTDTAAQRLNDGMKLTHNQQLDADGYGTTLHDGYSTTDSLQELQTRLRDSLQKVQQSSLSPEAKEDILLSLTKTLERLKQASQKYEQLRQSIRTDLRENLDSLFVTVQDLQQQGKEYFGDLDSVSIQDISYSSKNSKEFSAWLSDKNKDSQMEYVHSDIYSEFQIFRSLSRLDIQAQKSLLHRVLGRSFEPKDVQEAQELRAEFHQKLHMRVKIFGSIGAVLEGKEQQYTKALLESEAERKTQAQAIVAEVQKSGILETIAGAVSKKLGLGSVTSQSIGDGLALTLAESNTRFQYNPNFAQQYAKDLVGDLKKIALAPAGALLKTTAEGVLGLQLQLPASITKTQTIGDSADTNIFYGYTNFVPLLGARTLLTSGESHPNIAEIEKIDSNCQVAPSIQFTPGTIRVAFDVEFKNISKTLQTEAKKFHALLGELIDVPTGTIKQPGPEQMSKLGVRGAELYADLKSYFDSFSQLDAPSRSHLAGRLHRSLSHEYMMQLAKANEGWNFSGIGVGVIKAVGAIIPFISIFGQKVSSTLEHQSSSERVLQREAHEKAGISGDSLRNEGVKVEKVGIGL